jgi:thioredoxin reductase
MAELTDRPYPPGAYPVVVVGSGPGGLQLSYALTRLGIGHALLSADETVGGMFRRWPFFQRLLSWTKPYAPAERGSRAYERYDWNSLLADEPELRALQPEFMDGSSYFPSRPEMERNLEAFAERAGVAVRYGCRWTATRAEGDGFVVETTDGEYRCRVAVFAVGVAEPYTPATPGLELGAHYADTRPAQTYAGRRIFIVGKQNSGFELASGFLPWAQRIVLASPSPTRLSVDTKSLVGVRARYLQPYEDHVLGGGVSILDAAIERVEQSADRSFVVHVRRTDGGPDLSVEADDVIAATGFTTPLLDLPQLGVATFGQSQLPAQTPFWESATVPGIYFAGTINQGSAGLKKHGLPSNSGAVHGHRYNARVLARHIAAARFGVVHDRPAIEPDALVDTLVDMLATGAELWHQRAYLARVVTADPAAGLRDEGILPLAHVLDAGGPDAMILTLEADGRGSIYPVVYTRVAGDVAEHALDPHPLHDFATPAHRRRVREIAATVVGSGVVGDG